MTIEELVAVIGKRLMVSCQASDGHALRDTPTIARVARAAEAGGAAAIRCGGVGGVTDIRAVVAAVDVPVIGLTKDGTEDVNITPTVAAALSVVEAGADVVAADATLRPRPDGRNFAATVTAVHDAGRLVMADVATLEEGINAAKDGADIIATTLAGYTPENPDRNGPDLALVAALRTAIPTAAIVAEGRFHFPTQAAVALDAGATSVVVGTAITDPEWITASFVRVLMAKNGG